MGLSLDIKLIWPRISGGFGTAQRSKRCSFQGRPPLSSSDMIFPLSSTCAGDLMQLGGGKERSPEGKKGSKERMSREGNTSGEGGTGEGGKTERRERGEGEKREKRARQDV
eukprot:68146-Rhodomonas_salina.1